MQIPQDELNSSLTKLSNALTNHAPLDQIKIFFENYKQLAGERTFTHQFRISDSQIGSYYLPLLHAAVLAGHIPATDFFIKQGASLTGASNANAINLAVLKGDYEMVERLVEKYKVDVNTIFRPPLINQELILRYLMNKGFDPSTVTSGTSMIHQCAVKNDIATLQIINKIAAEHNLTINYDKPAKDSTPLSLASGKESLTFFIAKGANVNASIFDEETPLHTAVRNNNLETVILLLQAKARPDGNVEDTDFTPFLLAAYRGQIEIARLLYTYGANIKHICVDSDEDLHRTALHNAIEEKRLAFLEFLLKDLKFDPNFTPILPSTERIKWVTPLQFACREVNYDAAQLLLRYGADPNAVSDVLALTEPTDETKFNFIKLLLSHGADVKNVEVPATLPTQPHSLKLIQDCKELYNAIAINDLVAVHKLIVENKDLVSVMLPNGDTLLHFILKSLESSPADDILSLLKLLADQSGHLYTKDKAGKLPLDYAREKNFHDVVEILTLELERQLDLTLTDDTIPVIHHLLSGYKLLRHNTHIPQGIRIFIDEMLANLKILEPDNIKQIEALDQTTCVRKLFVARFDTLNTFIETGEVISQKTVDRLSALIHKSQVELASRQKFGLLPAMTFTESEVEILLRSLINLHHICNNQLRAGQASLGSSLTTKEMSLDDAPTPAPAATSLPEQSVAATTTVGFYSAKRKENPVREPEKSKRDKPPPKP